MYKIAWSPSQQIYNEYSGVSTTEKIEMEKLSVLCERYHNAKGGESMRFSYPGDKFESRPGSANAWNADCYVALHTNAGAGGKVGTETFFYKDSPNSQAFSLAINEALNAYFAKHGMPTERDKSIRNRIVDLYETEMPAQFDMLHTYIEVNFHDNAAMAKFMVNNWTDIAKTIVDAIWAFKKWTPAAATTPTATVTPAAPVTPTTPTAAAKDVIAPDFYYYRVCVHSTKSRNEAYAKANELIGQGARAFVAYTNTPTKK